MQQLANKKITITLAVVIAALFVLAKIFLSIDTTRTQFIEHSHLIYIAIAVYSLLIVYACYSRMGFRIYIILLFALFTVFAILDMSYSPIDEAMNFEYINHIIVYHRLPVIGQPINEEILNAVNTSYVDGNVINHEAMQAPIYYVAMAILTGLFHSIALRLMICRLVGLYGLLVIAHFVNEIIQLCFSGEERDPHFYRLMMIVFIFNPGVMWRASRVNNELFVAIFVVALLYLAFRNVLQEENKGDYLLMGFLCGLVFLTKNTAIYCFVIPFLVAVKQKKILHLIIPAIIVGVMVTPWFIFNYKSYGALTGIKPHLEFVLPIVNGNRENIDLLNVFISFLLPSFYTGEEFVLPTFGVGVSEALFCLMMCLCAEIFVHEIFTKELTWRKFRSNELDRNSWLNILCMGLVLAALFVFIMGTVSTKVNTVRGRYLYPVAPALILMGLNNYHRYAKWLKRVISGLEVLLLGCTVAVFLFVVTDKFLDSMQLSAIGMKQMTIADYSDENWKNGINGDGSKLLMANTGNRDYSKLIGRSISNGNQSAIIQDVQYKGSFWDVSLSHKINADEVTSRTWNLGKMNKIHYYNEGYTDNVGNANDKWVSQSFVIYDHIVEGVVVRMATYNVPNYSSHIEYRLLNQKGDTIASGEKDENNIGDNEPFYVMLDSPVKVRSGEKVMLQIKAESPTDAPMSYWITGGDKYSLGKLFVDKQEVTNGDLEFAVVTN